MLDTQRLISVLVLLTVISGQSTFTITNNEFTKDGKPFYIKSGSIHYSRVHPAYWEDRLSRMKSLGLNAIETYVPWNFHEGTRGTFDFTGWRDLPKFLSTAHQQGLLVLLRAGPYMCGEWDFGGLPAWLLTNPDLKIRTYDTFYINAVDQWWDQLLPKVKPLLYENGGPVIMMQVENEFGSYGNVGGNPADAEYIKHLVSVARQHLGQKIILYTTDGAGEGYLTHGTFNSSLVYTVVDFGPTSREHTQSNFELQARWNPEGMKASLCSEYYTGWLTHWLEPRDANTSSTGLANDLDALLSLKGSVSLYMGHGGTSFGFWAGANGGGTSYNPDITSYDYDSPIDEAGNHGVGSDGVDKYTAVRTIFQKYTPAPIPKEIPANPIGSYGTITLTKTSQPLLSSEVLTAIAPQGPHKVTNSTLQKLIMEYFDQYQGFMLVRCVSSKLSDAKYSFPGLADRVQMFVDGVWMGTSYRPDKNDITATGIHSQSTVDFLIENMGHLNYGHEMTDRKGFVGGVTVGGQQVSSDGCSVYNIPLYLADVLKVPFSTSSCPTNTVMPRFLSGAFSVMGTPKDTWLKMTGWGRGFVWVNGFNLGRYWEPKGPQHTLYVPAPVLKSGVNSILMFEIENYAQGCTVESVGGPVW